MCMPRSMDAINRVRTYDKYDFYFLNKSLNDS